MKTSLVLEGGGMRGIYTAGVLDFWMETGVYFLDCIGVSAGVLNALSYKSNQPKRSYETYVTYSMDKRYLSIRSLIKTRNIFGVTFIFETIPDTLLPFDYDAFKQSPMNLYATISNLSQGIAEYPKVIDARKDRNILIATSSLPLVSKTVRMNGKAYLDGGIIDPIPIKKAIDMGFDRHVVVLTREKEYQKKQSKMIKLNTFRYQKYPKINEIFERRFAEYNQTRNDIWNLEKEGKVFVICPSKPITIERYERDPNKLKEVYELGYNDATLAYDNMNKYLTDCSNVVKK